MILRLNRFLPENAENYNELNYITATNYPIQSSNYLNKIILLRYRDARLPRIINNRFYIPWTDAEISIINTNYSALGPIKTAKLLPGRTETDVYYKAQSLKLSLDSTKFSKDEFSYETIDELGSPTYFVIVRWDAVAPFKVIMISQLNQVIVSNTETISALVFPLGYTSNYQQNSSFFGTRTEAIFSKVESSTFKDKYIKEHIFDYPLQDNSILGQTAYTEYYKDIMNLSKSVNKINQSEPKNKSEIIKEILTNDPKLDIYPDENLLSYKPFYDKHNQDFVDAPRRSINSGTIIRRDISSSDQDITVVAENTTSGTRFITSSESFFYINSEEKNIYNGKPESLSAIANTKLCGGNA